MLQLEFMAILPTCALFEMQYFRFESFSSSTNSTLPLFAPFSMISFYNFKRTLGQGQCVLSYLFPLFLFYSLQCVLCVFTT